MPEKEKDCGCKVNFSFFIKIKNMLRKYLRMGFGVDVEYIYSSAWKLIVGNIGLRNV
jgi:hypothetical protein